MIKEIVCVCVRGPTQRKAKGGCDSEQTKEKKIISTFIVNAYKIMSLNLFNIRFEYLTRIGLLLLCINAVSIHSQ